LCHPADMSRDRHESSVGNRPHHFVDRLLRNWSTAGLFPRVLGAIAGAAPLADLLLPGLHRLSRRRRAECREHAVHRETIRDRKPERSARRAVWGGSPIHHRIIGWPGPHGGSAPGRPRPWRIDPMCLALAASNPCPRQGRWLAPSLVATCRGSAHRRGQDRVS
jgi:hypothetical protein